MATCYQPITNIYLNQPQELQSPGHFTYCKKCFEYNTYLYAIRVLHCKLYYYSCCICNGSRWCSLFSSSSLPEPFSPPPASCSGRGFSLFLCALCTPAPREAAAQPGNTHIHIHYYQPSYLNDLYFGILTHMLCYLIKLFNYSLNSLSLPWLHPWTGARCCSWPVGLYALVSANRHLSPSCPAEVEM